jgi:hypothetical protein
MDQATSGAGRFFIYGLSLHAVTAARQAGAILFFSYRPQFFAKR